jgi:molybdenum cofactor cytidylyltransferase
MAGPRWHQGGMSLTPHILILAAGSASRMRGADKLTEMIDGTPQLARITQAALATGCPVTVALPPDRPARAATLTGLPVSLVTVADPQHGMAESLKQGLRALPADAPLMLLLADLPEIDATDLRDIVLSWAQTPTAILRATAADGTPGHPVCFPPDLRAELDALAGDEGARAVLMRHKDRVRVVALPARHAITDLDTPEDWATWRAARSAP